MLYCPLARCLSEAVAIKATVSAAAARAHGVLASDLVATLGEAVSAWKATVVEHTDRVVVFSVPVASDLEAVAAAVAAHPLVTAVGVQDVYRRRNRDARQASQGTVASGATPFYDEGIHGEDQVRDCICVCVCVCVCSFVCLLFLTWLCNFLR